MRICRQEPHQLISVPENIFPSHRAVVFRRSPDAPLFPPPLHSVHGAQPRNYAVKLVHEHAQGEDHRRAGQDEHRSDEIGGEGAVVVAELFRRALHEVVEHQSDSVAGRQERVEEEQDEVLLVADSDAVVHPRAVVVHPYNAAPAETAMVSSVEERKGREGGKVEQSHGLCFRRHERGLGRKERKDKMRARLRFTSIIPLHKKGFATAG